MSEYLDTRMKELKALHEVDQDDTAVMEDLEDHYHKDLTMYYNDSELEGDLFDLLLAEEKEDKKNGW